MVSRLIIRVAVASNLWWGRLGVSAVVGLSLSACDLLFSGGPSMPCFCRCSNLVVGSFAVPDRDLGSLAISSHFSLLLVCGDAPVFVGLSWCWPRISASLRGYCLSPHLTFQFGVVRFLGFGRLNGFITFFGMVLISPILIFIFLGIIIFLWILSCVYDFWDFNFLLMSGCLGWAFPKSGCCVGSTVCSSHFSGQLFILTFSYSRWLRVRIVLMFERLVFVSLLGCSFCLHLPSCRGPLPLRISISQRS